MRRRNDKPDALYNDKVPDSIQPGVSLQPPPFSASGCPLIEQGGLSPCVPDQARRPPPARHLLV